MEEKRIQPTGQNKWKIAFITLCCIVIGFIGAFLYMGHQPLDNAPQLETVDTTGDAKVQLSLTKEQTNKIISYYLNKMTEGDKIKFRFSLDQQALITGKFKFLGTPMNFYLYFDPIVLENGDIKLKATTLSLGKLKLPIKMILNYIERESSLPKWIQIDGDKKQALILFSKMKTENGASIKAKDIDLSNDSITFDIYLPTEE